MSADPEKPKPTLAGILQAMQQFDQDIALDFDPKEVVGDLKDKVDAIKVIIDRLEFQAQWCEQQAAPFQRAEKALLTNAKRLKDYVVYQMQSGAFAELPGNQYRVKLQNNAPSLDITAQECTALDFQNHPNFVKQIRYYDWNREAIKTALVARRKACEAPERSFKVDEIPFAQLTTGQQIRFYPLPPAIGAKKGKS